MNSKVPAYAELLKLAGKKEEAKQLLVKLAKVGKVNKGMTGLLQSILASEKDSDTKPGV